ncbi:MAG: CRISPR-associated helicase Cas3' [Bacteroidota bacterium]
MLDLSPDSARLFWAKTDRLKAGTTPLSYHPLAFHNLDVAAAGVAILDSNPLLRARLCSELDLEDCDSLRLLVATLLALHDVGKFAEREFQARRGKRVQELLLKLRGRPVEAPQDPTVGHDTLGYVLWRDQLHQQLWDVDALGLQSMLADDPDGDGEAFDAWEVIEPLVQAVTGHHGSPPRPEGRGSARYFDGEAREAAVMYTRETLDVLPAVLETADAKPLASWTYEGGVARARRASWLLAGLAVLADWLGSNTDYFPLYCEEAAMCEVPDLETYWRTEAWPRAQQAVQRAGVAASAASAVVETEALSTLFPQHAGHTPTPLQAYAAAFGPGEGPHLVMLEDATGSGKTEAAVLLAHRLLSAQVVDGLYIGLPTRTTADHMHKRLGVNEKEEGTPPYRRLFSADARPSYLLAHSAREQNDLFKDTLRFDDPHADPLGTYGETEASASEDAPAPRPGQAECAAWLADGRKRALLADVGVGTIDQALLAVLPVRHQSLRVLGLATGVLIVDEVHAYDEYVSGLLRQLLRMQAALGGSAILLSATLPRDQRQKLLDAFHSGLRDAGRVDRATPTLECDAFPLATRYDAREGLHETPVDSRTGSERSVDVRFESEEAEVRRHLLGAAEAGRCAVWIRNTVHDAREAYEALLREAPDPDRVTLLHARFALSDRSETETQLRRWFGPESTPEDRAGRILVATQVVEQSLDLDFDSMVSDLAPVDLLIQRAGRLHRHRREADGRPLEGDAPDARGRATLLVLAPPLTEDTSLDSVKASLSEKEAKAHARAEKKGDGDAYLSERLQAVHEEAASAWLKVYEELFPRARYVYPHTGQLWRSARVLTDLGRITIPDDARALLRRVYDEEHAPEIPEALRVPTQRALNELAMARGRAGQSALHVAGGYGGLKAGGLHWFSDEKTPTRLGEPTTTVRLARWLLEGDEGQLLPWAGDAPDDWLRSNLPVRQSIIGAEMLTRPAAGKEDPKAKKARDKAFKSALVAARKTMPDGGRWSVLVVLGGNTDGTWEGKAKALRAKWKKGKTLKLEGQEEKPVTVTYSSTLGLSTR